MITDDKNFSKILFEGLDYTKYINENKIADLVGVDMSSYGDPTIKQIRDPFYSISPKSDEAFTPELDDLCRLHWLVTKRRVTTILEFGLGKSTIVLNDALLKNKTICEKFVIQNLRRSNPFECHSIDHYEKWIDEVKNNNDLDTVTYHQADLVMGTFADRICTYYDPIPNVCPDFIYLDGPDQTSPKGSVRGVSTNHKDRLPMAADILAIEHFLLPGTLIVTDGRTANARFIKSNLQRNWVYCHDENSDQHYFELLETPLGIYNKRQIDYCLGSTYFSRIK